jgi:hypothetical protein
VAVVVIWVTGNPYLAMAIAGVGETAAQTVEINQGYRQGYNVGGILTSAGTAYFTAAGGGSNWISGASTPAGQIVRTAVVAAGTAASNYVTSYAVNRMLGQEAHFNLQQMFGQAASAAVTAAIFGPKQKIEKGAGNSAGGMVSQAAGRPAIDWGNLDWAQIAVEVTKSTAINVARNVVGGVVYSRVAGEPYHFDAGQVLADAFGNAVANAAYAIAHGGYQKPPSIDEQLDAITQRTLRQMRARMKIGSSLRADLKRSSAQMLAQMTDAANERFQQQFDKDYAQNRVQENALRATDALNQLAAQGISPWYSNGETTTTGKPGKGYYIPRNVEELNDLAVYHQLMANTAAWDSYMLRQGYSLPSDFPGFNASPEDLLNHNIDWQNSLYPKSEPIKESDYSGTMKELFSQTQQAEDRFMLDHIKMGWSPEKIALVMTARYVGYKFGNGLTLGYWGVHDDIQVAYNRGQITSSQYWTSSLVGAGTRIALLASGGLGYGAVAGRVGTLGAGAIYGGVGNAALQASDRFIYENTGGLAGQAAFSWEELTISTVAGGVLGKFAGSDIANLPVSKLGSLRFQNPIVLQPGVILSSNGAGVISSIRSPVYVATESVVIGEGSTTGRQILYHYTNEAGVAGITESGSLNPSLWRVGTKDVRYGNGQYVSDIVPGTRTPSELSYDFLGQPFQGARFTHYLEIDATGLGAVQGRTGVYVIPNEVPLDLAGRLLNSGKVPVK